MRAYEIPLVVSLSTMRASCLCDALRNPDLNLLTLALQVVVRGALADGPAHGSNVLSGRRRGSCTIAGLLRSSVASRYGR